MKMALDNPAGANVISAYQAGEVKIRNERFSTSLIVSPEQLLTDWEPGDVGELRGAHFKPLFELSPEILILGTGENQVFPEPSIFTTLMDLGIGFEIMDNAAACRTYNILLGEGRRAALALMFARR